MAYLLNRLVDEAAERTPDQEYLRFDGDALTYAETSRRKNQIAHLLRDRGVQRGDRVGIYARKGIDCTLAMFGVLEAGAAFVPLDPWLPPERLAAQMRDCGIRVLFTDDSRVRTLQRIDAGSTPLELLIGVPRSPLENVGCVDWTEVSAAPDGKPPETAIEQDLAYIYYTSGSTGEPKGMMLTHRAGLAFADWTVRAFGLGPSDRIASQTPLHFDLSIFDFMSSALAGSTTIIVPEEYSKAPASVTKLLADERITVLFWAPIALVDMMARGAMESRDLSRLRLVMFGGEPFPVQQLRELARRLPRVRLANLYGVTEANATHYYLLPERADEWPDPLPLGRLAANMEAVLLDENDRPVEGEAAGELAIRTPTLMRGYWRRPELNARAFWLRPAAEGVEDRFYRTGDILRRDADGLFHFLGRKDRQVKSRSHRIELDEVQSAVTSFPAVREGAVHALPDPAGSLRIEAVVALQPGVAWRESELLQHVRRRVPSYAAPASVRVVDALPRTSAGKIDWQALRAWGGEQ